MHIITIIGTVFNMVGLLLIFRYGISPMTPKGGKLFLYSADELEKKNSKMHLKEGKNKILAEYGLYLSLLGMLFQAVPAIISLLS